MPELPEVETIKNVLNNILTNKKITKIDVLRPTLINGDPHVFCSKLEGKTFKNITRIGKYLVFHFSDDVVMLSHLAMEGKYYNIKESESNTAYARVVFHLDNQEKLCYDDSRCFGTLKVTSEVMWKKEKEISKLGPEPFDIRDVTELLEKTSKSNEPIKAVITDQSIIAGIGNIYADEILFACKIHPLTPAKFIVRNEWIDIVENAKRILKNAIDNGGSTIKTYHPGKGVDGKFQTQILAYGKAGEACPICGATFNFIKIKDRGTTYCPHCQKKKGGPLKIAIFGKIASGKSTVLNYFKQRGYNTISSDEIVSSLYKRKDVIEKINGLFNLDFKGEVDKKVLRRYLANHKLGVPKINKLIWPLVREEIEKYFSLTKCDFLVVEVPLLFEAKMESMFDWIIGVDADENLSKERLTDRNGINAGKALNKIAANNRFEENKNKADFIVKNNSSLVDLTNQLDEIISKLQEYLDLFPSLHLL